MTDAEAIAALSRGDLSALDDLVVRHSEQAQRLAYGVLRNPSLVHDVVADSFLTVARKAGGFDVNRPFGPWFAQIVIHRAINLARSERRRQHLASLWQSSPADDPAHLAHMGDVRSAIGHAFMRLTPRDRAVVVLRLVLQTSERESAEILGCAEGTVKSRLSRARHQLRLYLGEAGITPAEAAPLGGYR